MTADVALVGYYGRGNFGDDVLMTVAHRLVRQLLPSAKIGIRLPTEADYVARIIGCEFVPIPFGSRDCHQLIVHGGGGTFFDFDPHGYLDRMTNAALLAGGVLAYVRAESLLRSFVGRPRMSAQTQIGLGLGVGTFTRGSQRLREAISVLTDFTALWVRDPESRVNLGNLGVEAPVIVGSDLAFLFGHWCPNALTLSARRSAASRLRLGVILRDWPPENGATLPMALLRTLGNLAARYDLTVFSFDPATDQKTIAALRSYPKVLWQPGTMDIPVFADALAGQDVLLTARAHGAICGACVGRPSVILNIEPKLAVVHAMLPNTTTLTHPDTTFKALCELINQAHSIEAWRIVEDVLANEAKSEAALAYVTRYMNL